MAESRYEKYVMRQPLPQDLSVNWGRPDLGVIVPFFFLRPDGPLQETNTLLEYVWITEDCAFGVTGDRPPHTHNCDELFLFIGSNPKDPDDLGAEVEFWLGKGETAEQVKLTTSSVIYVPRGMLHLPFFCKNVKKPLLHMVIGLNIGEALEDTHPYPLRGV